MRTQRIASTRSNIARSRPSSPQKFGFNCDEKLEFSLARHVASNFRNMEKLIPFVFEATNMLFRA